MNLYEASDCSTSSRRTASQRSERTSSFDFPRTTESLVILAALPRQASCCSAAWVWAGRRVNLSTMRASTFAGYPFARRRSSSPCQRAPSLAKRGGRGPYSVVAVAPDQEVVCPSRWRHELRGGGRWRCPQQ